MIHETLTVMATTEKVKKVMVTREFGFPIYIAPCAGGEIQVSDTIDGAEIWGENDTKAKLDYHKSITGFRGLVYESLEVAA